MSFIADAHRDWHTVNGRYNSNCPLDCGAGEGYDPRDGLNFGGTIRCFNCKDIHPTVADVRLCHQIGY